MKVHEVMTGNARSVPPSASLIEAAGLMLELDVGVLPVTDGDDLVGIVTDRDMVVRGIADGREPASVTVGEVMSGAVVCAMADDDVEHAVRIMEQHQIRRLPVLNRERKLLGIISLGDVATSSNPAFSGMALRDVSEPNEPSARRRRLKQASEPAAMPTVPGSRRRPGADRGRGATRTHTSSGRTTLHRATDHESSAGSKHNPKHPHGRSSSSSHPARRHAPGKKTRSR